MTEEINMKLISRLFLGLSLSMALHVNAAVWTDTDGDINKIQITSGDLTKYRIYDASSNYTGNNLLLAAFDLVTVSFNTTTGNYLLTNLAGNQLDIGTTSEFIFGAEFTSGTTIFGEYNSMEKSPGTNSWDLFFTDNTLYTSIFVQDIKKGPNNSTVPEPSTVLLMGLGLFGLLVLRHRNKA